MWRHEVVTAKDRLRAYVQEYNLFREGNRMTNMIPLPPPGFDDLPVSDQIDYVQSLWDRISAKPEKIPVPDWHIQVLEQRLAEEIKSGESRPWQEVRDELRSKLNLRSSKAE